MAIVPEPLATLIALNRFGLGARPGDFVRAASDPRNEGGAVAGVEHALR